MTNDAHLIISTDALNIRIYSEFVATCLCVRAYLFYF